MATVAVQYVGPQDERWLPDLGVTVLRGETIEVSQAFAGTEPTEDDLGSGLLAQSDVWKRVTAPAQASKPVKAAASAAPQEG